MKRAVYEIMSIKIFFCYAREDELLLNKLKAQLKSLQRQGLIDVWHDRDISAGAEWEREINQHLDAAQIILLLISPDFMDSDYCYGIELQRAMQRHERGEARVIPVILRPVHWQIDLPNVLQALPTDAKPANSWPNLDDALYDVATGIRDVVKGQWVLKSNTYLKKEFYGEALQAIMQALRLDGRDAHLHQLKGDILSELGQLEDALAAFEQAAKFDPHISHIHTSKGAVLYDLGRYEETLIACEHAIELDPNYALAYYIKGKALQKLAQDQEALAAYEQATRVDPNYAEAYESKGQILSLLQRPEEAIVAYQQAAKLAPDNSSLYTALGNIFRDLKRDQDALAAFEQAVLLDPDNVQLLKEKAATLHRLKRIDEARDAYKKARQLSAGSSLIEMGFDSIGLVYGSDLGLIVLRGVKQHRHLIIKSTYTEAEGIANPSQETTYNNSLSRLYNLLKDIIVGLGASITQILITELIEETFYGCIVLKIVDKQVEYDVHAVDAIALAIYANVPIFVEEDVLERADINRKQRMESEKAIEEVPIENEKAIKVMEEALKQINALTSPLFRGKVKEMALRRAYWP